MFKARYGDRKNICGAEIARRRCASSPYVSQRELAEKLQLLGFDLDKNAVQLIEAGKRFVTDIELVYFAKVFGVTIEDLYPKE